jgi:hypothetical protein
MLLWTHFVDLVYMILFGLAGAFGGNMGLAIGFLSLTFRLALLPLTSRMAYRSLKVQAALRSCSLNSPNPEKISRRSATRHGGNSQFAPASRYPAPRWPEFPQSPCAGSPVFRSSCCGAPRCVEHGTVPVDPKSDGTGSAVSGTPRAA